MDKIKETEMIKIACPHFEMSIRTRGCSSAVSGAAYATWQNLFSEHDQQTRYYANKKMKKDNISKFL